MKRTFITIDAASSAPAKKQEFQSQLASLNRGFAAWVQQQLSTNAQVNLESGVHDYMEYVVLLQDRYLRAHGEVLTFGSGDCGQLGHGMEEDSELMVKFPRKVMGLMEKQIVGISCGGLHNAVYTASGAVYTWGCNDDGSLGRVGIEHDPIRVTGIIENEAIINVACGDGQTLCLSAKGVLYGWGCYKDKEGKKFFNPIPEESGSPNAKVRRQQDSPMLISGFPKASKVVDICCGSAHNLASCSDGAVYSWGLGECGELGRKVGPMKFPQVGDEEQEYDYRTILQQHITPQLMNVASGLRNVKGIAADVKLIGAGAFHSLVVTATAAMSTGLNNYGQLGHGDTENRFELHEISALAGIPLVSVKGGVHHSLALTRSGDVLGFGRGDSGQVGILAMSDSGGGEAGAMAALPVLVPLPKQGDAPPVIVAISCGANHNLAVTSTGDVFSWGYGDMLALGHGKEADEPAPKKMNLARAIDLGGKGLGPNGDYVVTQVSGGGQHSAIMAARVGR